jgi:protein Tex
VAAFGAFIDVGVHQDGLVHVSALANRFVSDPREVVKSGQVVRVKVLEADPERKRISLTLRLDDEPSAAGQGGGRSGAGRSGAGRQNSDRPGQERQRSAKKPARSDGRNSAPSPAPVDTALAEALRRAGLGK